MNNMPPVTKNLLIINVLCFLAAIVSGRYGIDLNDVLGLHYFASDKFGLHQLITYMFMHSGFQHIFFNMFAVWMFGRILENYWGSRRFLFFYIACGIGAGLVQEVAQYINFIPLMSEMHQLQHMEPDALVAVGDTMQRVEQVLPFYKMSIDVPTVGASGAVYAILMGFGLSFPNEPIFIFPFPVPIKAKWLIIGYFFIELWSGFTAPGDHVAHFAHLGGMIFGFLLLLYWRKKSRSNGKFY